MNRACSHIHTKATNTNKHANIYGCCHTHRHTHTHLGGVLLVVQQQNLKLLDVVDSQLAEAVGQHVLGLHRRVRDI